MKVTITLDSDEIAEAVEQYVKAKGILPEGDTIDVNLVAGRGQNGPSAVVSSESLNKRSVGSDKKSEPKKTKEPTPSKEPEPAGKAEPETKEAEGGPVDDTSLFGSDDTPADKPAPKEEPTNNAAVNPFADDDDGPPMSSGAVDESASKSDIDSLFG